MDLVLRAAFLYFFILIILRIAGRRTVAELSSFDMVLLLVIAEATDNSIIGDDHSLISTVIVISTFIFLEILLSFMKQKFKKTDLWLEGAPLVILADGKIINSKSDKEKIDESDIMSEARKLWGIERLDQIKYAILEKGGKITIIPKVKTK